jgi:hypothetical protein
LSGGTKESHNKKCDFYQDSCLQVYIQNGDPTNVKGTYRWTTKFDFGMYQHTCGKNQVEDDVLRR